jgi:hypothetical protein
MTPAGRDLILFLTSVLLAILLDGHEVRLREPARLDPDRPLPHTLNHTTLGFAVAARP